MKRLPILIFLLAIPIVHGCGTLSNTYCLTERQYVVCSPPSDAEYFFTCPMPNQFCANVPGSCSSDAAIEKTQNTYCSVCSTPFGVGHACVAPDKFAKCVDGQIFLGDSQHCKTGEYCDVHAAKPTDPCKPFSGRELICWKHAEPPKTDEDYCAEMGAGRHPYPGDATCRS